MWILVFFDLPTETKTDKKNYIDFRNRLIRDGFTMFQFSIYLRHCASRENSAVHTNRIKKLLPPKGHIGILSVTDKQFKEIELLQEKKQQKVSAPHQQLELW